MDKMNSFEGMNDKPAEVSPTVLDQSIIDYYFGKLNKTRFLPRTWEQRDTRNRVAIAIYDAAEVSTPAAAVASPAVLDQSTIDYYVKKFYNIFVMIGANEEVIELFNQLFTSITPAEPSIELIPIVKWMNYSKDEQFMQCP
jgi:hypothetical protein